MAARLSTPSDAELETAGRVDPELGNTLAYYKAVKHGACDDHGNVWAMLDPPGPQEAETAGRFLPERLGKTVVLLAHGLCNDGALAGGELEVDHKFVKHSEKALRYALGEGERVRGWRQILDDNTVRADAEAKAGGL
jgi:hypothetical protein